ncbi:MAG: PA2169 family four-helix-bundle protein [Blastocatellia bacterium]|nr:PA2169 family four-helix-bundle protein [Blastocatellia bacterium]
MNQAVAKPTELIDDLNGLIEICRDGQNGFADASESLSNPHWKTFCLEQSRERAKFVGELQQQVQWLGGDPENTGSTTAAIHRAWINLKAALGGGDTSIMAACETGEDSAVSAYQNVLDKGLPANIRQVVAQQYENVKGSHDRVRAMRNSLDE